MLYGFYAAAFMSALHSAMEIAKAEAERLELLKKTMSPEDFAAYMKKYEEDKEAQAVRDTEERRHREHCEAIRSTSFWRFGG